MLLSLPRSHFDLSANRMSFAEQLSHFIEGRGLESSFSPYCPNEHDDTFWTLDRGNDWKVTFYPEQPDHFRIHFRYNGPTQDKESALAGWLVARLDATIIGEPSQASPFPACINLP